MYVYIGTESISGEMIGEDNSSPYEVIWQPESSNFGNQTVAARIENENGLISKLTKSIHSVFKNQLESNEITYFDFKTIGIISFLNFPSFCAFSVFICDSRAKSSWSLLVICHLEATFSAVTPI